MEGKTAMLGTILLQNGGGRAALEVGAVTNWTLWITAIAMDWVRPGSSTGAEA